MPVSGRVVFGSGAKPPLLISAMDQIHILGYNFMGCWEGITELDAFCISSSKVWSSFQLQYGNILPCVKNSKGMSVVSIKPLKQTF